MKRLDSKGLSMVEVCFAVLILMILAQTVVVTRMVLARKTVDFDEHIYTALKAGQMFNELQAYANSNPSFGGVILDGYSDGSRFNLILTTDKAVTLPGNPLSGNRRLNGHWRFLRQVQVSPVDDYSENRLVVINIWICASDGNPLVPGLLLTTVAGTVIPGSAPTYTQTPQIPEPLLNAY